MKGHSVKVSRAEPQYIVESDKSGKCAAHNLTNSRSFDAGGRSV
ncbi:DUF2945 domain-containing protein [Rhizobium leguminosarum bv. viciae]|nr:DUF2945 domain-containing protein [Rhizobium leguminosarum bv. viciae]